MIYIIIILWVLIGVYLILDGEEILIEHLSFAEEAVLFIQMLIIVILAPILLFARCCILWRFVEEDRDNDMDDEDDIGDIIF